MSNRQLEEQREKEDEEKLASALNITFEDLQLLDYEIQNNESDDGLLYSIFIQFSDESPREILNKIKGLSDTNNIEISANTFDRED
jgi:hypothetical protein